MKNILLAMTVALFGQERKMEKLDRFVKRFDRILNEILVAFAGAFLGVVAFAFMAMIFLALLKYTFPLYFFELVFRWEDMLQDFAVKLNQLLHGV